MSDFLRLMWFPIAGTLFFVIISFFIIMIIRRRTRMFKSCPKCGMPMMNSNYDAESKSIKMSCLSCGYSERTKALDAK